MPSHSTRNITTYIMSIKTQSIKSVLRKDGIIPDEFSVILTAGENARAIHCIGCGRFMFYHQHRILAVVEDDMSQLMNTSPFTVQCEKCGNILRINVI